MPNKKEKIQGFANRYLRRIMEIKWARKIRNEELWTLTKQEPISKTIRYKKFRWTGHTLRKPNNDIIKQGLEQLEVEKSRKTQRNIAEHNT